jgi:hypothetical protein
VTVSDRRAGSDQLIRLTLSDTLGSGIDGAWWPYTAAMARELPQLVDVLKERLGDIVDITVNWSPLEGTAEFDSLPARGLASPGQKVRHKRVIVVIGKDASANLLVVPPRTSRALAVMVLRHAANLPILWTHQDSPASRTAADIVRVARLEFAERAGAKTAAAISAPAD